MALSGQGEAGLLFTNEPVKRVRAVLEETQVDEFARAGCKATHDVELAEGPLLQFPHNMEAYLRTKLGLPTRLVNGVVTLLAACLLVGLGTRGVPILIAGVALYFTAFNYLEGALPSLVSRRAPDESRGAALGLYATAQFLGAFCGGLLGGTVAGLGDWAGNGFVLLAILPLLWCTFVFRLQPERPHAST